MRRYKFLTLAAVVYATVITTMAQAPLDRTVLPIPEPDYPHSTVLDARDAKAPPRFEVKAPAGAPNVLIVLVDDMGFGMPSAFGGPVRMPTADRLASAGTALQPVPHHRALLAHADGPALRPQPPHEQHGQHHRNRHGVSGQHRAAARTTSRRWREMLRLNGYSTAFFGKNHETAPWEVSPSGPTDRWPTRSGFDKFYGFFGGETDQWNPTLYDGMTRIPTPHYPGYNFMTDMTDQAIAWMKFQKSLTPDKPFFIYFAPGATHAPHHVPKEWIAKYKGRFDEGWDKLREETLARQIALGVVPPGTKLANKPEAIKDWDKLTRRRAEALCPPDGSLCRLRRILRPRDRPVVRCHRRDRPARQHADLLHPRRQRDERRGRHERHVQRDDLFQRRPGDRAGDAQALRRLGRADDLSAHGRGLGRRGRHAVHVDQADSLQLRRHPQRPDRLVAQAHQSRQPGSLAVAPCH